MKRLLMFITAIAVMLGGMVLVASAANATETEEPPSCETVAVGEGTGECADIVASESHSKSSASEKVVAVNGVSLTSDVTVLARVRVNGTPPSQQTDCVTLKKARSLWTSYIDYTGAERWHWKWYPAGKRFCKINGVMRDPVCHNKVKIGVPKSKPPKNAVFGKVKLVKRIQFEAAAVAKADEKVTSLAKAWCTTQSASAYGEGRASASAYAVGRARLKGYVLVKLLARVRAEARGDLEAQLEGRSVIQVKADVRASAFVKATSEASAKAVCSDIPPPPPPPPANQPPTGEIVQFPAHLYPGGTYRAKVVGSDPEDQGNVTLDYTVTGGATKLVDADHPEICDVEGTQKVCTFWIKAGQTSGVNATLTLSVMDSKGLTFTASKTWPIVADEF